MALTIVLQLAWRTAPDFHNASIAATAVVSHASNSVRPIAAPAPTRSQPSSDPVVSRSNGTNRSEDKVQPGFVAWHSNFSEACETSKRSGKPVLLFEMLGKLDDEFC